MLSRVVTWGPANPGKSKLGEMFRRPMFAESRGEDLHYWPRIIIQCLANKGGTMMLFFCGCLGSLLTWQDALAVWEALLERGRSKL